MEDYIVLEHIGEGSFGKVYKGRRKNTGLTVAMKFITKHVRFIWLDGGKRYECII